MAGTEIATGELVEPTKRGGLDVHVGALVMPPSCKTFCRLYAEAMVNKKYFEECCTLCKEVDENTNILLAGAKRHHENGSRVTYGYSGIGDILGFYVDREYAGETIEAAWLLLGSREA